MMTGANQAGAQAAHPADLITIAADRYGARPAFTIVLPDGSAQDASFAEADRRSDAFAGFLIEKLALSPGDVVAVQLANGLFFPIAVFGAWKAGLIVTPINPFYTAVETRRQLVDSGARALVADGSALDQLAKDDLSALALIAVDGPLLPSTRAVPPRLADKPSMDGDVRRWTIEQVLAHDASSARLRHPVALYQYTGGTTGRSKAAIITADNLLATRTIVAGFFASHGSAIADGTALTALPLYHIFAFLFGILVYVDAGVRNVIVPSARPVANLRPAFETYAIRWMAGVDTLYAGLLAEEWFRANPPRLTFAIAGGAAVRPVVAQEWERLVSPLLEGYGLTETTGIVSCNPPTAARRTGSVGLLVPGSSVRIVNEAGADVVAGHAGELLVRGAQVASGYLGTAANPQAFSDGWFRTGDIASLDGGGMLTIHDRKKDMILVSGFNVFPNEVEAVLSEHSGVIEAAVIGIVNERTGEAVRAYVVLRDLSLTPADLDAYCRQSLAAYKVPRDFIVCDDLPKSTVGKVLRGELRSL